MNLVHVIVIVIAAAATAGPSTQQGGVDSVPDAPGRPFVVEFNSRAANLSWSPPINEDVAKVTHYVIHVRRGEEGEWNEDSSIQTASNETWYEVKNLSPFTTYSFRVSAVNHAGISALSKVSYYMLTLREAPSGKPTITAAHNTSSTSIQLSWRPPQASSLNGEFLGYRITYKPRHSNHSLSQLKEAFINDPEVSSFLIKGLSPFTQYLVSLQIRNPAGLGPSTVVVIMTDEGVPSQPVKVGFRNVTSTSVTVHWQPPEEPNGLISGYRVYFMHNNMTDVQTIQAAAAASGNNGLTLSLHSLKPFETYTIWLRAFTWKHEGASSEALEILTDVERPEQPQISNISCINGRAVSLRWTVPKCRCKFVEFFVLQHSKKNGQVTEELIVENQRVPLLPAIEYIMNNLSSDFVHDFKVCAAARSIYNSSLVYYGAFSKTHEVSLAALCDAGVSFVSTADVHRDEARHESHLFIVTVCVLSLLGLIAISIVLWKKCCMASYYFLTESPSTMLDATAQISIVSSHSNTAIMVPVGNAVPVGSFTERVNELHGSQNAGFLSRFQSLVEKFTSLSATPTASEEPPFELKGPIDSTTSWTDETLLQGGLRRFCASPCSLKDTVLFSYINSPILSNQYIAAQGSLMVNTELFWQFIWQHKIAAIVSITTENAEMPCDGGQFENLDVSQLHQSHDLHFSVKVLQLAIKLKEGESEAREVFFFHSKSWHNKKDDLPASGHRFLYFVEMAAHSQRELLGPVLVYSSCSTKPVGLYILMDAMLKQMEMQGVLDIDGYISNTIQKANFPLVQTYGQYVFVHDMLAQAVQARLLHAQS